MKIGDKVQFTKEKAYFENNIDGMKFIGRMAEFEKFHIIWIKDGKAGIKKCGYGHIEVYEITDLEVVENV